MTSITNRWKLGLFVVSAVVLGILTLLWLGAQQLQRDVEVYSLFFDEDVSGLEVGSPVKFRGVPVGSVSGIAIAPDRKAVKVTVEIFTTVMQRIGLRNSGEDHDALREEAVTLGLRAQLVMSGITGNKFVLVDYFDLAHHETLQFGFELPPQTFPTVASTVKSLQSVLYGVSALPDVLDEIRDVLVNMRQLTASLDEQARELDLRGLLESTRLQVDGLDTPRLSAQLDATLVQAQELIAQGGRTVDSLDADRQRIAAFIEQASGLAASLEQALAEAAVGPTARSVREAADSINELSGQTGAALGDASGAARDASVLIQELRGSARALESSLDAVRDLAELLERNPSALLRGRDESSSPPGAP